MKQEITGQVERSNGGGTTKVGREQKSGRSRSQRARFAALFATASSCLAMTPALFAADTAATFTTSATDLSVGSNYTPSITPTAASAYDVDLTGSYTTTTLDSNGSALVFGTLNDLDTTQALTIGNSNATAASITLSTLSNSIAPGSGGSASDLIFVQNGGTLNIGNGVGSLGLVLGVAAGNFDVGGTGNGTLNISSVISGATGFGFTKTGTGVLILGGANTYSGNTTETNGQIRLASSSVGTPGTVGSNGSLTSGPLGTAALVLTLGTLDLNGQTMGNRFTSNTTNNSITNSSASLATIAGAMDGSLSSNVISDFNIGGNNGNILVTGVISRTSGSLGFTKTGSDTVTFHETANAGVASPSDPVKVSAGTMVLANTGASAGAFSDSVTVQGGTLQFNPTLGSVSGGSLWGGQINSTLAMTSGNIDLNGSAGQNSRVQQLLGTGGTITNSSATAGVIGVAARNNNVYTFAGTIQDGTGTTGVDFSASGTTGNGRINEFTGANTYSGPTSISYGCFELGNALAAQNSIITVNAASGLGTSSTTNYSSSGSSGSTITAITTSYPLAFAGSIGGFTIGGLSGAGNFALTDLGYSSTFVAGTASTVSLQVGSSLATNASPAVYSGVISNGSVAGGTVTKIGANTETFSGNNTYTGVTSINNGILSVGSVTTGTTAQPLGENASLNLGSASTFGTLQYTGTSGTLDKAITLGASGGGVATSTVTSTLTLSGAITGSGSLAINDSGAGTVILSNSGNTITGGTVIQSGLVNITSATGFGTGTITLGASSGSNNAAISTNLGGNTIANPIIAAAGTSGSETITNTAGGGSTTVYSGPITLNHDLTLATTLTASNGNLKLTGLITGSRNLNINGGGTGNVQLAETSSSGFTGNVAISNNSILYASATSLGTPNVVSVDSGSQLNSAGQSLTIAGLNNGSNGGGSVVDSTGTGQTLTIGGSGIYSFGGPITNGGNVKIASGATQTLTGASTYTGSTTISAATLSLNDSSNTAVLGNTSLISVASAGLLNLTSAATSPQLISATAPWSLTDAGGTSANPLVYLSFTGTGGSGNGGVPVENVFSLSIDGVGQPAGLYGVGATNPDSDFGGTGEINVVNSTPEPGVLGVLSMSGLMLLRRRRGAFKTS